MHEICKTLRKELDVEREMRLHDFLFLFAKIMTRMQIFLLFHEGVKEEAGKNKREYKRRKGGRDERCNMKYMKMTDENDR